MGLKDLAIFGRKMQRYMLFLLGVKPECEHVAKCVSVGDEQVQGLC